jgi:hypothetical protein
MDGEERLRRIEQIVGPEALRRARETVRETMRHWERVAGRDPDTSDDQEAGSGSDPIESGSA